jgi:hypothetical protein
MEDLKGRVALSGIDVHIQFLEVDNSILMLSHTHTHTQTHTDLIVMTCNM